MSSGDPVADHGVDDVHHTAAAADRPLEGSVAPVGLWASLGVLVRRWWLVLSGLVLTAIAAGTILLVFPVTYSAQGSLLFNLPETPTTATGTEAIANPVFGSRSYVGDLVVTMMSAPEAGAEVAANGGTGTFTLVLGRGDAVLVSLTATGDTAEEALATWNAAAKEADVSLQRLQQAKGASADELVTITPLTTPTEATKDSGSRIRAAAALLVLGVAATILFTYAVESYSRYRKSTRGRLAEESDETAVDTAPDAGVVQADDVGDLDAEEPEDADDASLDDEVVDDDAGPDDDPDQDKDEPGVGRRPTAGRRGR